MTDKTDDKIGKRRRFRPRFTREGVRPVAVVGAAGTKQPEDEYPEVSFYFERLMEVAISNTFYNVNGSLSPDFTVLPTHRTKKIINSLGMLFRDRGVGFSVLYDTKRTNALLHYLSWHTWGAKSDVDDGAETRLSFVLNLHNPNFYYFTNIPFDFDVGKQCYYASNRTAHVSDGRIVLTAAEFLPKSKPLPTVEGQLDIPFLNATRIEVLDVLGNVVQCYPRIIPVDLFDNNMPTHGITCRDVDNYMKSHPDAVTKILDTCTINFFLLPSGLYTIRYVDSSEKEFSVIYRGNFHQALCFIDLFLTDPIQDGAGIYPVCDLDSDNPIISNVTYNLNFQARSTRWEYFIVPPAKGAQLLDLQITGTNGKGEPVAFSPAQQVPIGLDTRAYMSMSEVDLQLQSHSECVFKLSGRIQHPKGMTTRDSTLMPRLPVASPNRVEPILPRDNPASGDGGQLPVVERTYGSAIYVYL
ncbi:MAG: hypothetical protein HY244_12785 [Rhizobiales bacterium]|nr:hypothetical protein [Hyphomicrobiales bacterium]